MRILFATNHPFLPQFVGGSERSTHDLCRLLIARGDEVAVLSGLRTGDVCWFWNRMRAKLRPRYQFPMGTFQGYAVFRGWDVARGAAEVVRRFAPDAVVVQAGEPLRLARVFDALGVPTLVYLRDTEHLDWDSATRLDRVSFAANSRFVATRARERLAVQADVIPPVIDYPAFITRTKRRTATLINPHPKKGVHIALSLAEARRDIPFEFIESWHAPRVQRALRSEASKLPNIRWRGPTLQATKIFQNTRILLVPSQSEEAWGRVVNEAQASGIPVIASKLGGLPESVGRGGVLVSPHDDPTKWLRSLSRLWDDPAEYGRLSTAAHHNVRRPDLQPDRLFSAFLDVITRLLARSRGEPPPPGAGKT
jgi:glycosyltransferase involved in cell wall biosynthesis